MADSTASPTDNSALLAQILSMLQNSGKSGTPPTAPNQATNNQGQAFQLGAGGLPTAENPGSSPTASLFDSATATSLPTSGMSDEALQNWYSMNQGKTAFGSDGNMVQIPSMSSGGSDQGNSYGKAAANQGGTPEPGTIRAWMNAGQNGSPSGVLNGASLTNPQSAQFNQLIQQFKDSQAAPTAPSTDPIMAPLPAPVVNNQAAYTDPSQARIPGMGGTPAPSQSTLPAMTSNSADIQAKAATGQITPATVPPTMAPSLSEKLNQGTIQPSDLIGAGGPLQASTGSGIAPGSLPVAQAPQTAVRSYLNGVPGNATPPTPSQSPTDWNPLASSTGGGKTVDMGSADAPQPMFSGGANAAQGGLDATTGSNAASLAPSGDNYASGGLDSAGNYDASGGASSVGGGPSGMQMGSAIGSGISKIGSAIAGAYAPIQLKNLPTLQQSQQLQPKPLAFTSPQMVA